MQNKSSKGISVTFRIHGLLTNRKTFQGNEINSIQIEILSGVRVDATVIVSIERSRPILQKEKPF